MSRRATVPVYINDRIYVQKTVPNAEFPSRERVETPIWNLTLVNRTDNREEDELGHFNDFGTGLKIKPPQNHFIEIVASHSLHKHGYILYHPVIIDANYQGEVKVPLYKLEDKDDLALPFEGLRIIVRPSIYAHVHNVSPPKPNTTETQEYITELDSYNSAPRQIGASSKSNYMF